jgi:DNA-binding CsgD family transcriptional regulator
MRALDQPLPLIQGLLQLGLVALARGRAAEAEAHACEAIAILRENRGQVWLAEALMVLASAIAVADPRRAAYAFAAAEHLLAYHHAPLAPKIYAQIVPYVRVVHDQLGPAIFAETWREGARCSFDEASALAEPAALANHTAQPLLALAAPAAPPASDDLDRLSRRELAILRLVAAGLTNKAIAEQLMMSVNTVHSHVKSIFSKLDVTTRAAATREALVRGLVEP